MKTTTSTQIKKDVRSIWPVGFIWLVGTDYNTPSVDEVCDFLKTSQLDKEEFIAVKKECDHFALQLHAEAKRYFVDNEDIKYPLAFGEVFVDRWAGWPKKHNANICVCDSGIYLIEPQTDEIRKASNQTDNVLIVKM